MSLVRGNMDRLIYYLKLLFGSKSSFTLETRIFHAVCLVLIVCISVNIPIAFYLRIPELPVLLGTVAGTAGVLYYFSRVRGYHQVSAGIFQVFVNIALALNYYYNSGINGPSYTIFLLAFLVSVATSPTRQYVLWLPLNILLLIGLLTIEFRYPGLIKFSYADDKGKYIDLVFSYVVIAGFAFLITAYIRRAYNRQREELIANSEALEAANVTKNKLLSIIGHDLKEPLASLQNYLEILVDFDLGEKEKRELESQLLAMTKNASIMLSNILHWTKGQMQSFNPDLRTLSVSETLGPVLYQAENIGKNKQIHLHTDIPESIYVKADQQMFELIVRNLLMNAIKFTPKGGNIWLKAYIENKNCVITVSDDGLGIPAELQKNIFLLGAKSQQGTELEGGVGLGLTLCKEFTEMQSATIDFSSTAGQGTTFRLVFPPVDSENS